MIGAVDIGGTKFAVGIVSETGIILARTESPSFPERGAKAGISTIIKMLRETLAQAGGTLRGIGIGCTGPVNPSTGELGRNEFLPGWEGLNLVDELQKVFRVSTALENDADAAALGEFAWGAGRGLDRFIYLTVSTGIGGGIVLNGQLYRGADGSHPEIGHHVIDPSGPKCFCGAEGCWESLASGLAFARSAGKPTAYEVCESARHGDVAALAAVEQQGFYLGLGLANLITLFVPDMIALGGGVMQSFDLFEDKINGIIQSTCRLVPAEKTQLLPALLGRDVGLAGAAQVWKQRFGK
jgi:glucokinase